MRDLEKLTKALLGDDFPTETILICAGRAEGRRLLQQCASGGACLVGVSTESPMSLAMDICSAELSLPNAARLINDNEAAELILELLTNTPPEYYNNPAAQVQAVAKELLQTFYELDMACIDSLSGNQKINDTHALRELYQKTKAERNLLDKIDLLKRACKIAVRDDRRYVALSSYAPTPLERKLLDQLASEALTVVPIGAPNGIETPKNALSADVPSLTELSAKSSFYRCRGMDTEVRFLFRDLLMSNTPAEECAVIYLSGDYAQQIYETAARFHIPVAMSAGIPLTSSSMFTMLSRLLALPEQNYDVEQLCNILSTGVFSNIHAYHLADQLRQKRVGWGKDRYLRFLEDLKKEEASGPNDKSNQAPQYAEEWEKFFTALFSILEPPKSLDEQKAQQQAMIQFLLRYTNRARPGEAAAYACTAKLLSEITLFRPNETVIRHLVELMKTNSYLNSPAQPGQLFCVPLSQALCTGRRKLYILGLSRYALQGSKRESPILSEEERGKLGLKTAQSREDENTFRLLQAVLQHEGEIIFCYPDFDSERMLEQQPSIVYTDLRKAVEAKKVSSVYTPDPTWIAGQCPPPYLSRWNKLKDAACSITYIPAEPITAGDHMLQGSATARYASSWNSAKKTALQPALDFRDQIKDFHFSSSSLEAAFQCPLSFYLDKILKLRKPNVPEYSYDHWLPKNTMGTFCHDVLEKYYRQIIKKESPDLDALIEEERAATEANTPVPSKELQERDLQKARMMIENAIEWTKTNNRTVLAAEQPFGKNAGHNTPPIKLAINSKILHLSGSIDRVDTDGSKTAILDYKTGDTKHFVDQMHYHLQHYLYTLAQEQLCNQTIDKAGYLFLENPAGAEYCEVIEDSNKRNEMAQIVENLLEWLSDEGKCMEWAPCLALQNGQMTIDSMEKRDNHRKNCSNFCIYSEFCENLG